MNGWATNRNEGMKGKDRAYWLADKIPAYGDYAKEAALVLRQQADEIERLRHILHEVAGLMERRAKRIRDWVPNAL